MENTTKNSDCTVVVCSCDKYADLLAPFSILWRKYWPDCPFETVLVTETAPDQGLCFHRVVACGKGGNWCSRLVQALETISTPYVIMLCDDYYLSAPVNTANILLRLSQAKNHNAANLRLIPNPLPGIRNSTPAAEGLLEYRKNTAYCIATQAGIWNREFLQSLAKGKASIWEFERYGSFAVGDETRPLLVTREKEFPFVDAVHKSYWEKEGLELCRRNDISLDLTVRGRPPFRVKVREALKSLIFALFPWTLIVRIQNLFNIGMKERSPPAARAEN